MLKQIGAAPGEDVPEEASAYARKLERNQPLPAAEPDDPVDSEDAAESAESPEPAKKS
jgi:hypothetical protein